MAFKFIPMFALVSLTLAIEGVDYNAAPVVKGDGLTYGYPIQNVVQAPAYKQVEYEQFAPAAYDFNYQVHDEHTGDIKSQKEVRNGDAVQGRYELIDSDGFRRIVEYTADAQNGFNAVVHREPVDIRIPQPIPQDPKLSYAAPAIKDIPVQAYPVNKAAVYAVPKYSTPVRVAPQYYAAPSFAASTRANQEQGAVTQSAPVFSTPVHSAALQNAYQTYEAPRQVTPAAPVNVYYQRPAFNNQGYSVPSENVKTYSVPTYNTVAYSAPTYSQQAAAVLSNNAYADTFAAYNQKYFSPPAVQAYYSSPAVPKLTYSAPATVAGYTSHLNDETSYNNLVRSNTPSNLGGLGPIQFPQTRTVASNILRPTQSPSAGSDESKFDVRSTVGVQQNYNPPQTESESNNSSSPSYAVSTTPVYKH